MLTAATNFLRSGENLIPIGLDTAPSILAVLLQREARRIQEAYDTDDTPLPPITRQYAAAIATADITPHHTWTGHCQCSSSGCMPQHCPLNIHKGGKYGKRATTQPIRCNGDCY